VHVASQATAPALTTHIMIQIFRKENTPMFRVEAETIYDSV
jgi:hypothetical protein